MWYLIYYDNYNTCYVKRFLILCTLHRFIEKNCIKDYKICESVNLFL